MARVNIYVHVVWATKRRSKILQKKEREILFNHIEENAKQKSIEIKCLNGYYDHVHCILRLGTDQNIGQIVKLMKGESACWANKNNLFPVKLIWAEDYYASSISESALGNVKAYVYAQEVHHSNSSTEQEYELSSEDA